MLVRTRRIPAARGSAPRRRKLTWSTSGPVAVSVAAGGAHLFNLLGDFEVGAVTHVGATVMRTHLHVYPDMEGVPFWIIGVIVGRQSDTSADLDPVVDANRNLPWSLFTVLTGTFSGATADQVVPRDYDIKSRRKLPDQGSRYVLAIHNDGGTPHTFRYFARTLLALP